MRPKDDYDRMNPDKRLVEKLKKYSTITWGAEAYPLSVREAEYLLETIENLEVEVMRLLTDGIEDD